MPKVSDKYVGEKKNEILDCARRLIREIPLYKITMRDIIKDLKCSQGMIYNYYKGVDEIYVDLMNREIEKIDIKNKVNECISSDKDNRTILRELFGLLGDYILSVQEEVGGEFYFEILVCYAFDEEKKIELLPSLLLKQNLMYVQRVLIEYITENEKAGVWKTTIPIEELSMYAGDTIDGISNHAAISGKNNVVDIREKIMKLYVLLGEYVVNSLI